MLAIHGGNPIRENFLVYGSPEIGEEEVAAVTSCLKSGWLSTGPIASQFEKSVVEFTGAKYSIGANSCTALLHLGLLVNKIGIGDEVITTPMTFGATVNVIEHVGATPIFADLVQGGFHIDPLSIEAKITPRTRAIMPVHYAGSPCDMDLINSIARKHNLVVIEDAAHAIGTRYKGKMIGSGENLTAFSLYVTKNIAAGEGGILTSNDVDLIDLMRVYALHGMSRGAWQRYTKGSTQLHYDIVYPGYKYNMPDLNAAIAIEQLKKIDRFTLRRREIAEQYFLKLSANDCIELPESLKEKRSNDLCTWHIFPILLNLEILKVDREAIMAALIAENIGVATHYRPIYEQKFYREKYGLNPNNWPNCEKLSKRLFSIPLSTGMTQKDIDDVVNGLNKVLNFYKK